MPEPITASVVAKTMAKGAISKVGGKILESVAPGIFSNQKDFDEIKSQLKKIAKQLDEVLDLARDTFDLVEKLPNIVADLIDEQTLYLARTRIESSIQVYVNLNTKPNAISHNELTDLLQSWNILIDKELKTQVINQLPRFGEFILAATDGKLYEAVLSGIKEKKVAVEKSHQTLADTILSLGQEAERIISTPYIRNGNLTDDEPWLTWRAEGTRTRTVTRYIPMPCSACNGDMGYTVSEQVPDTAWNNALTNSKNRLSKIKSELERLSNEYRSLIVSDEVLRVFEKSLIERVSDIVQPDSNYKVLESSDPFTTIV